MDVATLGRLFLRPSAMVRRRRGQHGKTQDVFAKDDGHFAFGAGDDQFADGPMDDSFADDASSFRSSFNANCVSHFLRTEPERFSLNASGTIRARDHPILLRAFMADQAFLADAHFGGHNVS